MRIHTYEQNEWTIRGKYETVVEDDEDIFWMKINKEHVLPMWLVSIRLHFILIISAYIWVRKRMNLRQILAYLQCLQLLV
jgi:Txe/YoeB family toxin of Txe-Axe toxin-antitoxin module